MQIYEINTARMSRIHEKENLKIIIVARKTKPLSFREGK